MRRAQTCLADIPIIIVAAVFTQCGEYPRMIDEPHVFSHNQHDFDFDIAWHAFFWSVKMGDIRRF